MLKIAQYEGAPIESLRHATRRAFENLINLAVSSHVDFILISGDLYDGDWRDYNTGLYFVSQMGKLREAGIPVYIITGNHDAAGKMTKALRLPDNVCLFSDESPDTFRMDQLQVAIHGQGFATPAVRKDLSAGYPTPVMGYFNIGMLHTCATGREGHESYAPCHLEGLRSKGYDYWALGHIHQREILGDDPLIIFPGNIQGRHIRETGSKGCMMITVEDDKQAQAEFQPLDVIRWVLCSVDLSDAQDGYDGVDKIRESLESLLEENEGMPLVARIEITGASQAYDTLAADPEQWLNEIRSASLDLSGGEVWIEKIKMCGGRGTLPSGDGQLLVPVSDLNQQPLHPDGPIGEILCFFDELRSDPAMLQSLGEPLNNLWKRLPRELKENFNARPGLTNPGHYSKAVWEEGESNWLADMLEQQVKPLLLHRLTHK